MNDASDQIDAALSEARAREAALAEVLDAIRASQHDSAPVFAAIMESATRLCGAPFACILLKNPAGTHLDLVAHSGTRTGLVDVLSARPQSVGDPASHAARVVRENVTTPVQIEDLTKDEFFRNMTPQRSAAVDAEGMRTLLIVPLVVEGTVTGEIFLYRREVRPFSPEQIALIQTFAAQAVIAIENVRQFRAIQTANSELQTRLEREEANREILEVISRSRDDELPVFDVILENARKLCKAPLAFMVMGTARDSHQTLVAHHGANDVVLETYRARPLPMDPDASLLARAIVRGEYVHVADLREDDVYMDGSEDIRRMIDSQGVRTIVYVPMVTTDEAIGAIALFRNEVDPFEDRDIELVQSFAAQAVIAIENVRQFRALQTRLAREAATREILEVISLHPDNEQPVFDAIMNSAARLCGAPHAGLMLRNAEDTHLLVVASNAASSGYAAMLRENPHSMSDQNSLSVEAVTSMQVRQYADVETLKDYTQPSEQLKITWDLERMRTLLYVPLIKGDRAIGTLVLYRLEVKEFSEDDIALLKTFAAQAVIAIDNVRQFREVQTRLEREAATREILEVISRSRDDEQPVFDAILARASRLCDCPTAGLHMASDDRAEIRLVAHRGLKPETLDTWDSTFPIDSPALGARSVRDAEVIHIEDISDDPLYRDGVPMRVTLVETEGMRTLLSVPLMRNGIAVGCLWLFRREARLFGDSQIELLQTFAAQAVIAIENVRQFRAIQAANAELETRLEREAATREILEAISRSRDDEGPVFEVILDNAVRLCEAPLAHLLLANDAKTHLEVVAHRGTSPEAIRMLKERPLPLNRPQMLAPGAFARAEVVTIDNLLDSPLYKAGDFHNVFAADTEGIRTIVHVPLVRNSEAIGVLTLYRREVRPFDSHHIDLVRTFAAQAAIAIENVRQFRELQTRLEREAATREVLQVINRSRDDEQPVFRVILENASRLCDAPLALLSVANEERTRVTVPAHSGVRPEFGAALATFDEPMEGSDLVAVKAVADGKVVRSANLKQDSQHQSASRWRHELVEVEGVRSIMVVPLMNRDRGVGAIILYRREVQPFSDDDLALVQAFAAQAVIAIENVRQFKALEARTEEVQRLNASLEERVEEQVGEIERMGKLKSFLPAAVADTVVSQGADKMLKSHRALLGVLFCDIRGFTAFCETAEPEETIEVLQTYHEEMGKLIVAHGAGVDHRMGDGIMVLFNDPVPCEHPAGAALGLAMAMRERMAGLCKGWKRLGHRLGFGVGISLGYATVGMIGYEGRYDYTASGSAVNLAARLSDRAEDGDILLSPRAYTAVEDECMCEPAGRLELKGLSAPVEVMKAVAMHGDGGGGG